MRTRFQVNITVDNVIELVGFASKYPKYWVYIKTPVYCPLHTRGICRQSMEQLSLDASNCVDFFTFFQWVVVF